MQKIGKDVSAAEAWRQRAESYASGITGGYHRHRLQVIEALLPSLSGASVVDFGCGEGVLAARAFDLGARRVFGLDIDETLIALAKRQVSRGEFKHGTVADLGGLDAHSTDCVLAANVLHYCTAEEDQIFYREAARILKPGGTLVVTHSNALFDMFTLNAYTVAFFRDNFDVDARSLLTHPDRPNRTTFNIRENPLAYRHKLASFGFREEQQEFMNYHARPPLLTNDDPDDMERERPSTLGWPEAQRWRLPFQCSMFGVRATLVAK